MIDWLSLIEQHNDFMLARELTEESRREYKERERMARVIRELVEVASIAKLLPNSISRLYKVLDNLSDDAKEILA